MTKLLTYHNLSELMWKPFISNGGYIQPFVGVMSQNEGMCNVVEAGNVAALGRKTSGRVQEICSLQQQIFDQQHIRDH